MKKRALQIKSYKEAEPTAMSVQQEERRYPTPIPLRRTRNRSGGTDDVTESEDGSMRFVQDHLESEINRQLEEAFGEMTVDSDDLDVLDLSPEATAERVFDIAKGCLETWRDQNPEISEEELIDSFEEAVRAAIDQGYERAVDIFSGVEIDDAVLESAVETVSILHKLLSEYFVDLYAQLDEREA